MVSDQELANCVESLLRQTSTDASASSAAINVDGVVQQLEAKLGLDLSHKVGFIRDQIGIVLHPPSKEHFPLHLQQQQLQQLQQQQYLSGYPLLPHHQISQSPFNHLPQQHELAFQPSPVQMHQQRKQAAPAVAIQKQGGGQVGVFAPGTSRSLLSKGSGQAAVKKRGGSGGLNKVCRVSPELQAIVGEPTMARTQIVRQLWAYIKRNNLQDPSNKRKIICNDKLRLVFETDCTDMFNMNKLLAKHIRPLDSMKDPGPDSKRTKTAEAVPDAEPDNSNVYLTISNALADFFGTGEKEMLQSEASKRIWDYIKEKQLEDPSNEMVIQFDSKLQQLFGCDSISTLGVPEILSRHLFRKS